MLERAKRIHPDTKHVLFDSWFSSPSAILDIKEMGFDVVARFVLKNSEWSFHQRRREISGKQRFVADWFRTQQVNMI
jgi:hypothetical protein